MTQSFTRLDPYVTETVSEPHQAARMAFGAALGTGAPETLDEMGHALLDIVRQAAVAKGVTLPARQMVYPAPIPADCEQVAVLFTGWNVTPIQDGGTTICKPWRWIAPYSVIITRCTPAIMGKGPNRALKHVTTEQMDAAAKLASDDTEVLLETMNRLGEVGSDVSLVANAPSGGYQTVELNVPLISGGSFL
jgi:hypothetical protein